MKAIHAEPTLEALAKSKAKVEAIEAQLSEARNEYRAAQKAASDAAPFYCQVCMGGIWDQNKPHVHFFFPGNKKKKYNALVIKREPTYTTQKEGER